MNNFSSLEGDQRFWSRFFREKPNLSVYLKKTSAKLQKLKNVARNFAKVSLVCLGCLFLSFYHKWSRLGRIVYLAPVKHEVAQFTWGNTHQKTVIILVVICDNFWENTVRVSIDMAQNPPNSLYTGKELQIVYTVPGTELCRMLTDFHQL